MNDDNVFDGSDDSSSGGDAPLLVNNDDGAAAWLEKDTNGDAYLSISLPFGLSLNLFGRSDREKAALNQLYEHLESGGY